MDDEIAGGLNAVLVAVGPGSEGTVDPGSWPLVIIGVAPQLVAPQNVSTLSMFDVVVEEDDPLLEAILATIERHPIAAAALAVLLRNSDRLTVEQGLAAESAVYSTLQGGSEFADWLATARPRLPPADPEPAVLSTRTGDELRVELNRPHRHNAFSVSMRDGLSEALALAAIDESIERIVISGRGPSFCSGGDLGEFGSRPDPATAHRTRLTRSPARLLHRLGQRTTVRLHGACLGAGIELPAFAGHITATRETVVGLPELSLGLIPGAGGTVSLPRRIGRHRTAYLGLTGEPISADRALQWGLIDEVTRSPK